jgi:hypothetical protein
VETVPSAPARRAATTATPMSGLHVEFGAAKLHREPEVRTNTGIGIFTAKDPFAGIASIPRSFNPYMYANNNPLLFTDPSGRFPHIIAAAALGYIIGGVSGYAFGKYTYNLAMTGDCGCDMFESAAAAGSAGNWADMLSKYGALIGAAGAAIAASGPVGMIYMGMFGLTASSVDLLKTTYSIYAEGFTPCKAIRFMVDVALMAVSAAAIQKGFTEIYAPAQSNSNNVSRTTEVLREAERLRTKANLLHEQLNSQAQSMRTTAVGIATNADGETIILAASSEPNLTPAQRSLLLPGEIAVRGPAGVHAEIKILNYCLENGLTLEKVVASRPICSSCISVLTSSGVELIGPLKDP